MKKGNPKFAYHRSDNPNIKKFKSQDSEGYERKHSASNHGIYFHQGKTGKYGYGRYEYKVLLNIENPFRIDSAYYSKEINPFTKDSINIESVTDLDLKYLKENGYDGIIGGYPSFQVVVFDPDQICIVGETDLKNETHKTL